MLFFQKNKTWRARATGLAAALRICFQKKNKVAWVHAASLGEFEQGRPVIEALRRQLPDWQIVLTFFSPSGYEKRKDYAGADAVFYLPHDTPGNARDFLDLIRLIWRFLSSTSFGPTIYLPCATPAWRPC